MRSHLTAEKWSSAVPWMTNTCLHDHTVLKKYLGMTNHRIVGHCQLEHSAARQRKQTPPDAVSNKHQNVNTSIFHDTANPVSQSVRRNWSVRGSAA